MPKNSGASKERGENSRKRGGNSRKCVADQFRNRHLQVQTACVDLNGALPDSVTGINHAYLNKSYIHLYIARIIFRHSLCFTVRYDSPQ